MWRTINKIPLSVKLCISFTVIFCLSFVFVYNWKQHRIQHKIEEGNLPFILTPSAIGTPIPSSKLINSSGESFNENDFRKGKIVLLFVAPECSACSQESHFLRPIISRQRNVLFYGITAFGSVNALADLQRELPCNALYDENGVLTNRLEIYGFPTKIYLEDGIIRKVWAGAAVEEKEKDEFTEWLKTIN